MRPFLYSLDARAKLLILALIIILQIFLPLEAALPLFLAVLLLYFFSGISMLRLISQNRFLLLIPLFPALGRALLEQGAAMAFGVAVPLGIYNGALHFLFLSSLVFLPFWFSLTTGAHEAAAALRFYGMPKRWAFIFSLASVSAPQILKKAHRAIAAQKARGGGRNALAYLLPVLHFCFQRAGKMSLSISARGFDAENIR